MAKTVITERDCKTSKSNVVGPKLSEAAPVPCEGITGILVVIKDVHTNDQAIGA